MDANSHPLMRLRAGVIGTFGWHRVRTGLNTDSPNQVPEDAQNDESSQGFQTRAWIV